MTSAIGDGHLLPDDYPVRLEVRLGPRDTWPITQSEADILLVRLTDNYEPFVEAAAIVVHPAFQSNWTVVAMYDGVEVAGLTFLGDGGEKRGETAELGFIQPYTLPLSEGFFTTAVENWVSELFPSGKAARAPHADLAAAVEVFYSTWTDFASEAALDPEDKRIGDAFAEMAIEVCKVDNPPKPVLREVFAWFGRKLDMAADEFAKGMGKSAGIAAGTTFGVGIGAAASGHLPNLVNAVNAARALL